MPGSDRYTIISADGHAGGNHAQYREYLDPAWRDEFDAWRGRYKNPFRDLQDDGRTRNWDTERRLADLDAEGVAAEVLFPNTVPPFFPTGVVIAPAPSPEDFPKRLAGLRAHNRWLVDFVAEAPLRRAGLAQIALNDVDEAVKDVYWTKEQGLSGILLPGVSPDTPWIDPLFSEAYDPVWAACQETDLSITHHAGGSGIPNYGKHPAALTMFVLESGWFANRALWHLIMAGVFERFPGLKFVMTEQGSSWLPPALTRMDDIHASQVRGRMGEIGMPESGALPHKPSDYFKRNCFIGASFPPPSEAATFHDIGIDKIMWGSDYPHNEACSPLSRESLRRSFEGWSEGDLRQILAENQAHVYGFDLEALAPIADRIGPTVDEIATPLDAVPDHQSPAFQRA
ncbi:amidohydrolase family protein [Rhabdothermincola salaria]|uniref:amidohydrolase family protein n=1 Tax=Rhabdothermincola salaria TaxID=2903142 RepID=UPI001E351BC6|nr:amidohydrolase family protein [Rhabdothermincola salaria]MCD9622968.1 amidohydrolase [Rhabdothermincola salaria]